MATKRICNGVGTVAGNVVLDGPTASQFRDKDRYLRITSLDGLGQVTNRWDGTPATLRVAEWPTLPAVAGATQLFRIRQNQLPLTISAIASVANVYVMWEIIEESELPESSDH